MIAVDKVDKLSTDATRPASDGNALELVEVTVVMVVVTAVPVIVVVVAVLVVCIVVVMVLFRVVWITAMHLSGEALNTLPQMPDLQSLGF